MSTIKDLNLAPSGERKIRWVEAHMPVLRDIGSDFAREKPFAGLKIALSVHLEAKTAYLCRVLEMGGAEMHVTGLQPAVYAGRRCRSAGGEGHGRARGLRLHGRRIPGAPAQRALRRAEHHHR